MISKVKSLFFMITSPFLISLLFAIFKYRVSGRTGSPLLHISSNFLKFLTSKSISAVTKGRLERKYIWPLITLFSSDFLKIILQLCVGNEEISHENVSSVSYFKLNKTISALVTVNRNSSKIGASGRTVIKPVPVQFFHAVSLLPQILSVKHDPY